MKLPLRERKILASAEGQSCVRCGTEDGTICARHYNGFRGYQYGSGRGTKCHTLASAELCFNCDLEFSEMNYGCWEGGSKSIDRSEQFLHFCVLTNIQRFKRGDL